MLRAVSSPPHIQDSDWYNIYSLYLRSTLTDILNASIIEASSAEEPKTTQADQTSNNTFS